MSRGLSEILSHFTLGSYEWRWQLIGVAISLVALFSYYLGYLIASRQNAEGTFTLPGYLCLFGGLASLAWLVMPFLPQPRLPGIIGFLKGEPVSPVAIATQLYGFIVGAWFFAFTARSTRSNWSVTYHKFFAPERLITDGQYGVVRHPMLIGDFLCHAGIAIAAGGIFTIALIAVYYVIAEAFIEIQERYVLYPKFKDEYREYTRRTPRSWSKGLAATAIVGIALVAGTLATIP
jgi:protein-S-isoprenylcysteine O-methyltransferase Ste14